jgi:hypothetical protein
VNPGPDPPLRTTSPVALVLLVGSAPLTVHVKVVVFPGLIVLEGLLPTVRTPERLMRQEFLETTALLDALLAQGTHFDFDLPEAVQLEGVALTGLDWVVVPPAVVVTLEFPE